MSKWSGKTRGGLAGYQIFVFVIKYLGIGFAYTLLRFVTLYFLFFSDKKPITHYFKKILGYSRWKVIKSIYQNYNLLGQVLVDKIAFLSGSHKKFTFTFEGEHFLTELAQNKQGGLLIGAHMGNWEIAGQLLERIDIPVNIVMLESEHQRIKNFLDDVLQEKNMKVIPSRTIFHIFLPSLKPLKTKNWLPFTATGFCREPTLYP
jgi:predicted LPLAT superfamily acyltransferase